MENTEFILRSSWENKCMTALCIHYNILGFFPRSIYDVIPSLRDTGATYNKFLDRAFEEMKIPRISSDDLKWPKTVNGLIDAIVAVNKWNDDPESGKIFFSQPQPIN